MGKKTSLTVSGLFFETVTDACTHFGVTVGSFYYQQKMGHSPEEIFQLNLQKKKPKRRTVSDTYNFSYAHPDLLKEFAAEKNPCIDPSNVTPKSGKRAWWRCQTDLSHEWEATFRDRSVRKGCPFCAGKRVTKNNSLIVNFPNLAREYAANLNKKPIEEISVRHGKRVWWRCDQDHTWLSRPADRTKDNLGCPYCAGRLATPERNLAVYFPEIASQLDIDRQPDLDPYDITPFSSAQLWWRCHSNPRHVWRTAVSMRTKQNTGCPYCANLAIDDENCLEASHPHLSAEWDFKKNRDTPKTVVSGSIQKVWWRCNKGPDHIWCAPINHRANGNTGCPFCAGRKLSVTNSLDTQRPDIAAMLVPELNPEGAAAKVYATSAHKKLWFRCDKVHDHIFQSSPNYFTVKGGSCPICASSKLERETVRSLSELGVSFQTEYSFADLRGRRNPLRFDFYLSDLNALIECDGEQHFKVMRYDSDKAEVRLKERKKRDRLKDQYCTVNRLPLLRIHYQEKDVLGRIRDFVATLPDVTS